MGFLSRKKQAPAPVEETHPIEEELQAMEQAVPERTAEGHGAGAAGPVAEIDSPALRESSIATPPPAAASEDSTPERVAEAAPQAEAPAGPVVTSSPEVAESPRDEVAVEASPASPSSSVDPEDEGGPARMRAIDLLAPSRQDIVRERE